MTAAHFLDLLQRSQLLVEERLSECLNFQGDGEQLAAAMVKAELLTEWQAEKLVAGKFKGFVLGDYTILSYLRRSGMGQDYVARHNRTKRKVTLSVLPVSRVEDSTLLDRFRCETSPAELEHDGQTYYVVRPFDEGGL